MERRSFIKSAVCLGCLGMAAGCSDFLNFQDRNSEFFLTADQLPRSIRLEACSLCQLRCPACVTLLYQKKAPKDWVGYLKFDDFKKFVDENDFIKEIELSNKGEIFLNPELDEIIKYAHHKGITLTAGNGVNFNSVSDTTLENLVKYQVKHMTIAIDGATPETYKIYRVGGDFNKVIDNIKKIKKIKKKYNSEFPKLTWQFIPFGHNEHEILLAKKKAQELNMEILYKRNMRKKYSPVKNRKLVEELTGIITFDKFDNSLKDDLKEKTFACYNLFNYPQIDYNGLLLGCNRAYIGNFGINVFEVGLLNALNYSKCIYAKRMLTDFSTPPKNGIPCTKCHSYTVLKSTGKPLNKAFFNT